MPSAFSPPGQRKRFSGQAQKFWAWECGALQPGRGPRAVPSAGVLTGVREASYVLGVQRPERIEDYHLRKALPEGRLASRPGHG